MFSNALRGDPNHRHLQFGGGPLGARALFYFNVPARFDDFAKLRLCQGSTAEHIFCVFKAGTEQNSLRVRTSDFDVGYPSVADGTDSEILSEGSILRGVRAGIALISFAAAALSEIMSRTTSRGAARSSGG